MKDMYAGKIRYQNHYGGKCMVGLHYFSDPKWEGEDIDPSIFNAFTYCPICGKRLKKDQEDWPEPTEPIYIKKGLLHPRG